MQNIGKIVQVIGAVVDISFPKESLPRLLNAIEIDNNGVKLIVEVLLRKQLFVEYLLRQAALGCFACAALCAVCKALFDLILCLCHFRSPPQGSLPVS